MAPSIVVNVVPAIFTSFPAWIYCKITGAKLVIHVQDFESDTMLTLGMSNSGFLLTVWIWLERFVLSRADTVSIISKAMVENAVAKGVQRDRVIMFPNWSEVSRFQNVQGSYEFRLEMGFKAKDKLALYSGNIGRKQGLELVIEAAKLAEQKKSDIVFILCGEGAAKADLVEMKTVLGLSNVYFFPLQPYESLPKLLDMADAHLVVQNPDIANAVLPSKLTNILAVGGNAVITTHSNTEIGRLLEEFPGIAIGVEPENCMALLSGIEPAISTNKLNDVVISNAKKFLAKQQVLEDFEQYLVKVNSN
jgi:colanic acid biosynthesis glycosyl transferase WcaI